MSDTLVATLQTAVEKHRAGNYPDAESAYRTALELCGSKANGETGHHTLAPQVHHNLGVLLIQAGHFALALPHLKRAVDMDPRSPGFWLSYAQGYFALGLTGEARAVLSRATQQGIANEELTKLADLVAQREKVLAAAAEDIVALLPLYAPASSGGPQACAPLALAGANRVPILLAQFVTCDSCAVGADIQLIEDICKDDKDRLAAGKLAWLFSAHGSDKSHVHNYQALYGHILSHPISVTALLEIGLGTNNEDVVSNMTRGGKPGASLRAFHDFLPTARIFGADIDRRVLFTEDRIETYFVDQTDPSTFTELDRHLPEEFDLIIDDGLHSPDANLATMIFALNKLKRGGWFVVEDISLAALPIWKVVAAVFRPGYEAKILRARWCYVFAVRRL